MRNHSNENKLSELMYKADELLHKKEELSADVYRKSLEELVENFRQHHSSIETQKEESNKSEKSNNHFRILFDHAPLAYCLLNLEGEILQANTAFEDLFDRPADFFKRKKLHTFIEPDSRKDFNMHLKAVRKNERPTSFIAFEGPGGPFHAKLLTRLTSINRDEEEKVILCALNDISSEITYYKELHKSEERFRSLVNAMNDVIFTIDQDLKHSGVYGNWRIFQSKAPKDFIGKTPTEVMGPQLGNFHEQYFRKALKGKNITYDWSYEAEKGRKHVQTSLSPIYDENKEVIEIVGAGRDITETQQNNFELQERVKEQKCLYEISRTLQKTHRPLSKILQKTVELIPAGFQYPELAIAKIRHNGKEYISNNDFDSCSPVLESRILMEDGNPIEVFVCYKTSSQHNEKPGFLIEEQDLLDAITENLGQAIEHVNARKELNRKNKMLNQLNAEKDRLFSVIAHDLRSPFTSIMGLVSLMEEKYDTLTEDSIQQMIRALNKSTNSLFALLENLLEWSQIQRGQTQLNPQPHKSSDIVEEAVNTQYTSLENKNISIHQSIPEALTISVDKTSVLSVFNNLLTNAIKFTPRGGSITISARYLQNKTRVEFAVCDSGIGMNQEMQNNLFRIDADVKRSGTEDEPSSGLGLLISKEFVEMNGGKIRVKSKEYEGTCFYFTLPVSS
ncbi:MAG: PAS domain-containing sensor histidine kinase [Bacteroidota bacterium]